MTHFQLILENLGPQSGLKKEQEKVTITCNNLPYQFNLKFTGKGSRRKKIQCKTSLTVFSSSWSAILMAVLAKWTTVSA